MARFFTVAEYFSARALLLTDNISILVVIPFVQMNRYRIHSSPATCNKKSCIDARFPHLS